MRRGSTLSELILVLAVISVLSGVAIPRFSGFRDRISTDGAAASVVSTLSVARHAAVRRAAVATVVFDTAAAELVVFSGADTVARRSLRGVHGVRLRVSRDTLAFSPSGMGFGLANAQIIVSRGAAADTVTVSRLGRVRR